MTTQTENEIWIMEIFLGVHPRKDLKIIAKQESPDFIISLDGNKIGVEITEVFQDSNLGDSKMQQYSSVAGEFGDELIYLIQPHVDYRFSIGVNLDTNFPLKKSTRKSVLQRTADICVAAMMGLSNHQHIDLENYYDSLPDEVKDIHIYRFDEMPESINSKPEGGTVATLTIAYIQPILTRKERKLHNYTTCDNQWLVIREGNYYAGSFSELSIDLPIKSRFDKVYLLRSRTRELIDLK
jgi:hypothetical protein